MHCFPILFLFSSCFSKSQIPIYLCTLLTWWPANVTRSYLCFFSVFAAFHYHIVTSPKWTSLIGPAYYVPHVVWDLHVYVFDTLEAAAAAAGSKMCAQILVQDLTSWMLQRFQSIFDMGISCVVLSAQDSAKWWPFLIKKSHWFLHFSPNLPCFGYSNRTLSGNVASNDLDQGHLHLFWTNNQKSNFCTFLLICFG